MMRQKVNIDNGNTRGRGFEVVRRWPKCLGGGGEEGRGGSWDFTERVDLQEKTGRRKKGTFRRGCPTKNDVRCRGWGGGAAAVSQGAEPKDKTQKWGKWVRDSEGRDKRCGRQYLRGY